MGRHKPPSQSPPTPTTTATLTVVHPYAAAIDVHSDTHVVCVGPGQVQSFGAYTADLHALADHLTRHGVTAVVLESTGVYFYCLSRSNGLIFNGAS